MNISRSIDYPQLNFRHTYQIYVLLMLSTWNIFLVLSFYQKCTLLKHCHVRLKLTEWWTIIEVVVICSNLKISLKTINNFSHTYRTIASHLYHGNAMFSRHYPFMKVYCFEGFSNWNQSDKMLNNHLSSCNLQQF